MADNKGCEYCKGRAYTKKPVIVITIYGRKRTKIDINKSF